MLPPYTVRRARPSDLDALLRLHLLLEDHLEASNPDLWRMSDAARGQLRSQLVARLTAPESCALVAEHGAEGVVGMLFGRVISNTRYQPTRSGTVDQLFVLPEHRRHDVGSGLVRALCDFLAAQAVEDVSLRYVHGNHQAAAFWAALGFRPRIITSGASLAQVTALLDRALDPAAADDAPPLGASPPLGEGL
jgi:ribosomal protein S18 acetylase RimI-like enzyme